MQAYKITKKVRSKRLILNLPLNLQSKELEITIQPVKNGKKKGGNGKTVKPSSLRGVLKGKTIQQIDDEIREIREEWERGI
jgi:hypothetical protein